MKLRIFLLSIISCLLVGCTKGGSDISSDDQDNLKINEVYYASTFDEARVVLPYSIEGYEDEIIGVNGNNFAYYYSVDETSGITFSSICCFGVSNNIVDEYEDLLAANSYSFASSSLYAFKEVNDTSDLIVQYDLINDEQTYFELIVYQYTYRTVTFPTLELEYYLGDTIIPFNARSYFYNLNYDASYRLVMEIECFHVEEGYLETYLSLISDDYSITQNQDVYFCQRNDLVIDLLVYQSLDNVYLKVTSSWPYAYLMDLLNEDLPRLEQGSYTALEFSFVQIDEDNQILSIYYDGVNKDIYDNYLSLLTNNNFIIESSEMNTSTYTIHTAKVYKNRNQENEHFVQVMYCVDLSTLCIAIYY